MNALVSRGLTVESLSLSVHGGEHAFDVVPGLLAKLLEDDGWREFVVPETGVVVQHERFTDFLHTPPRKGLGASDEVVLALCSDAPDVRDLVQQRLREDVPAALPNGRPSKSRGTGVSTQTSDTAEAIVAKLKRDDPDLAEQVVRGEVTPNAAALRKGWRKPRIVVSSPESVAAALRKYMSDEDVRLVAKLLAGD